MNCSGKASKPGVMCHNRRRDSRDDSECSIGISCRRDMARDLPLEIDIARTPLNNHRT
ncbi:hypothetical protein LBMAG46_06420 [Planctomycetia bacterium]|jgi:hypothetical protein|nr:hypothetical protein LBMAG46_06420 [Planctomycetia bacterium]